MKAYLLLALAIAAELFGTSMLKVSEGFTKLLPSICVVLGFGIAFYALSLSLKSIPLSTAYAIWSGVGTLMTALLGVIYWKEKMNVTGAAGIVLIVAGVVLLNLNGSAAHGR